MGARACSPKSLESLNPGGRKRFMSTAIEQPQAGDNQLCQACGLEPSEPGRIHCQVCVAPSNDQPRCPVCHSLVHDDSSPNCLQCETPRPASGWPLPPLAFEGYDLIAELDRSSCIATYLANDVSTGAGKATAIRIGTEYRHRDMFVNAFMLEYTLMSRFVDSSSVTRSILAARSRERTPYITYDLPGFPTLTRLFESTRMFKFDQALSLGISIARVLHEIHGKGLLHLSLSPSNIFVSRPGQTDERVMIGDLTFAFELPADGAGMVPAIEKYRDRFPLLPDAVYAAPEQIKLFNPHVNARDLRLDPRTDMYALGLVLYQMLTGEAPFDPLPENNAGWSEAHKSLPVVDPRNWRADIPPDLADLVLQCLEKNPIDRPANMPALIDLLQKIQDAEQQMISQTRADKAKTKAQKRKQRLLLQQQMEAKRLEEEKKREAERLEAERKAEEERLKRAAARKNKKIMLLAAGIFTMSLAALGYVLFMEPPEDEALVVEPDVANPLPPKPDTHPEKIEDLVEVEVSLSNCKLLQWQKVGESHQQKPVKPGENGAPISLRMLAGETYDLWGRPSGNRYGPTSKKLPVPRGKRYMSLTLRCPRKSGTRRNNRRIAGSDRKKVTVKIDLGDCRSAEYKHRNSQTKLPVPPNNKVPGLIVGKTYEFFGKKGTRRAKPIVKTIKVNQPTIKLSCPHSPSTPGSSTPSTTPRAPIPPSTSSPPEKITNPTPPVGF